MAADRPIVRADSGITTSLATPFLPWWLPVGLVLVAIPFLRPNIFGESLSPIGLVLLCTAACVTLLRRPGHGASRYSHSGRISLEPAALLVAALALAYLWLLLQTTVGEPGTRTIATIQGMFLTLGSLIAISVVCQGSRERTAVARGFVIMIAVLSASYLVSALCWAVGGIGLGQILTIPVSTWGPQPVYFPFTITVETQPVFGLSLPRLNGVAREPGWMSMYCAIAYFLADRVGMQRWPIKVILLVGLLGCVSTAGFGVFVVAWAYHIFLRDRGGISLKNYLRQLIGIGMIAVALWLAIWAPVLGLSAKEEQNATSLSERQIGTEAGVRALFENPWGGNYEQFGGGINLISDIAVSGFPFVLLVCLGLLLTFRSGPTSFANSIALVVLLTMLTSQPGKDSTWAFGLVLLACTLRAQEDWTAKVMAREVANPAVRFRTDYSRTRSGTHMPTILPTGAPGDQL